MSNNEGHAAFPVVRNRRDGWSANSEIDLGEKNRRLSFSTYKGTRGIVTSCSVSVHEDGVMTHALFRDYSHTIKHVDLPRATEQSIRAAHTRALAQAPAIEAEARAFYVAKEAKDAALAQAEAAHSAGWAQEAGA